MIRFTPPGYQRLEESVKLDVQIGGTESNVATALARLGARVSWASKLPKHPLGRLILRRVRGFGVDVGHVCWSETARMGLYFVEAAVPPRAAGIIYDRAGSAASTLCPGDFDWRLLDDFRHLHLTGITPALSDSCAETVRRALAEARKREVTVSFDLNYRSKLWSPEAAAATLEPLLRGVDLFISTMDDARLLFGVVEDPREAARSLEARTGARRVTLTLGGEARSSGMARPSSRGRQCDCRR